MKNSQAWSMDIMIAVVLFIGVIFAFYWIFSSNQESKEEELKEDATIVLENLNITEDISQIDELLLEDYTVLKRKLRVENEFCLYFEDEDGNLIELGKAVVGKGSSDIELQGIPCGLTEAEETTCRDADSLDTCDLLDDEFEKRCCTYLGKCCPEP